LSLFSIMSCTAAIRLPIWGKFVISFPLDDFVEVMTEERVIMMRFDFLICLAIQITFC
jgi:hypothetical protein